LASVSSRPHSSSLPLASLSFTWSYWYDCCNWCFPQLLNDEILLWNLPLRYAQQRILFLLCEVANAWASLEVFVLSIIVALVVRLLLLIFVDVVVLFLFVCV
jgi:hypothetical protein